MKTYPEEAREFLEDTLHRAHELEFEAMRLALGSRWCGGLDAEIAAYAALISEVRKVTEKLAAIPGRLAAPGPAKPFRFTR